MLKKTMTYKTFDGDEITEDFYFHLSKADIAEMDLTSENGGLVEHLETIVESKDGRQIMAAFKMILRASIGRRSEDGKRFIKSDEIADEFMQTNAYNDLFMQFVTDANAAADFIVGVLPDDLNVDPGKLKELQAANGRPVEDVETKFVPAYVLEDRNPTQGEMDAMTKGELKDALLYIQENSKNRRDEAQESRD